MYMEQHQHHINKPNLTQLLIQKIKKTICLSYFKGPIVIVLSFLASSNVVSSSKTLMEFYCVSFTYLWPVC